MAAGLETDAPVSLAIIFFNTRRQRGRHFGPQVRDSGSAI